MSLIILVLMEEILSDDEARDAYNNISTYLSFPKEIKDWDEFSDNVGVLTDNILSRLKVENKIYSMSYYDFPFTIRDICDLEGIRLPNDGRQNHTAVCPACGKHTLSISTGKNNFNCFSCGVHGGMLQLYILCKGESLSLSESRREIMERLGLDEQDGESNYQKRIKEIREKNKQDEVPQSSLRSELELDETYEELLNMLSLSKDHFDNLIERGLSEDYIKIRKYRSYPISSYQEFPRKIMEQGHYVDGVPGFYKDSKGNWNLKTLKRGIMIPIINLNNQICGFQIRKDNALLKESSISVFLTINSP